MAEDKHGAQQPLVVGVGASAGGLDALQTFLRHLPFGSGFAFIVVFHLDPSFQRLLPEVLAKSSHFAVVEAADGMPIEADRIYTAPGHSIVSVENDVLHLASAERPEERQTVIDRFFQSLAAGRGDRAVAVVLSGAGSDGSLGLKAVAEAGGLTMVQEPATAKHDSMPLHASAMAVADHVLPPAELAEELLAYARHISAEGAEHGPALLRDVVEALPQVCEVLLQATGQDFRHYKTSTVARRTLRRIQVHRSPSVQEYIEYLRSEPAEAERLFKELLVNVTAFFRDPEAFEALVNKVLRRLFAGRSPADPVRLWVPGCATGEEAYTIAMLLREQMDGLATPPEVQVFATDIDEAALAVARQGSYPLSVADEVTPERIKRFFVKKGQRYHVTKEVRDLVVFSVHNLINDPPFSRLDVISCRNLLIYLGSHLQKKLIPLFHYALRPGGYLFLGPSESLAAHRELFRPVDGKSRISQRLPTAIRSSPLLAGRSGTTLTARSSGVPPPSEADTYLVMQRIILDEFAPKAVVVNEEGQVISASGNLEKYLTVTAGAFHNSITRLVRDGLRVGLRAALSEAAEVRRKVVHDGLSLRTDTGIQRVMITVQPMPQLGEDSGLFLVVFHDVGQPVAPDAAPRPTLSDEAATLIEQLERELSTTRQDLEKSVQDLESANEELKSANEELLSMNEELQSANEELETSKEEVQTANEALTRLNSDLENLLASTQLGTLFLDDAGNVRRATAAAGAVYNIFPTDSGRPLDHFTHKAVRMPPLPDAAAVRAAAGAIEDEVEMQDGTWFLRRVLPYRTSEGAHEGIVITFTDVTGRKRAEEARRRLDEQFRALAANISQLAWMARPDGHIFWYNRRWYEYTGTVPEEVEGWGWQSVHDPAALPAVLARWRESIASGQPFDMVFPIRGGDGVFRPFLTRINPVKDEAGKVTGWFGTNTDLSELRAVEEQLRKRERELTTLTDNTPDILTRFDRQLRHVFVSAAITRVSGHEPRDLIGKSNREVGMPAELCEVWDGALRKVFETGQQQTVEFAFEGPAGVRYYTTRLVPEPGPTSALEHVLGVTTDITERRRAEEALDTANRRKDEFLATLAHELRNPLAPIRNGLEILAHAREGEAASRVREMMERQLSHMVRLVDDLLDISRISSGKVALRKERVTVQSAAEIAVEASRPAVEAERHTLDLDFPREPIWINADLTRFTQIITNLLTNAAKYTPEGGRITLAIAQEPGQAVVRVTDTGLGIPREMLAEVFEMFTQVNRTLDRSQGGLGIGLALVKKLVEMHAGTITADSPGPAQGSTFTVRVPSIDDDLARITPVASVKQPASAPAPKLRILVVDDNEDSAESLAMLLDLQGHTARMAFNGPAALEAAKDLVPDLVFLDIGLPGMDGHEVARRLRQDPELAGTRLVALTGWGSVDDKAKTKAAGFDHHLTKPVEMDEVKRIVASLRQAAS